MEPGRLLKNYENLEEALRLACLKANRNRGDVKLVAVSKFHPAADIAVIAAAGQVDFGENYMQEAQAKKVELAAKPIRWHMIGHVQSRKAAQVAGQFDMVHTLDSIKLANGMERQLRQIEAMQQTLIEINIAEEPQKSGIMANAAHELIEHVLENCPHIVLKGLMCLPPVFDSGDAARPYFAKLRELRDNLSRSTGVALPELSMGMSGDFNGAIAEGATIVRIGTDIFGPRPIRKPEHV